MVRVVITTVKDVSCTNWILAAFSLECLHLSLEWPHSAMKKIDAISFYPQNKLSLMQMLIPTGNLCVTNDPQNSTSELSSQSVQVCLI